MIRTLVAGLGNMGRSHALAYHHDPAFEIVGLVNRSPVALPAELCGYPVATDFHAELARLKPDLVAIATYSDSHADYAVAAMEAGAHVFVEKPLATTVADAERVARMAGDDRPQGGRRLHPAPPPLLAAADRGGPRPGRPVRVPSQPEPAKLWAYLGSAQGADADHAPHRRLRRALCRRHVPDHRRRARRRSAAWACASSERDRARPPTTTATSRCSSPTARSAGTRPAGGR